MNSISKLLFLHIPKTGGTTFNHILFQNFTNRQQFKIEPREKQNSYYRYKSLSEKEKNKIKIIRGHFYYGIHNELQIKKYQYFTIIREPVKRMVSHYYYSKSLPKHYLYTKLNNKGFRIDDFFSGKISYESINGQTAQIAGFDPDRSMMDKDEILDYLKSSDLLEKAISNIESDFSFIGLTEKFDQTLYLLNKYLNFNNYRLFYKRKNVSSYKQNISLSSDEIKLIKKNNELDLSLYQYVRNKYQKAEPNSSKFFLYSDPSLIHQLYLLQLKLINRYLR